MAKTIRCGGETLIKLNKYGEAIVTTKKLNEYGEVAVTTTKKYKLFLEDSGIYIYNRDIMDTMLGGPLPITTGFKPMRTSDSTTPVIQFPSRKKKVS
jgi:hypothetical protein